MKISASITKGKGKGKQLGFPTVNIVIEGKVESGVYTGVVRFDSKEYLAGIFVGRDGKLLEAHLIGFEGDLYGKEVEVEILEKIRNVRDFENEEELKKQIGEDINKILNSKF